MAETLATYLEPDRLTLVRTRTLGPLEVSVVGLGCNNFGRRVDQEGTRQVVDAALDAGVTFFDTAESYGGGQSEAFLGHALSGRREQAVLATKFGGGSVGRGKGSREEIRRALDGSLARLGVPTIDLYYLHFPFTNIEAAMDHMAQAVQTGKIRAVGVSNCNAVQMRRAAERLARYHIPLAANEVRYNLLHRQPEVNGVLDACRELNVALVAYMPLASGQLVSNTSPARGGKGNEALHNTLQTIAQRRGKSKSQVALNWLLQRDEHIIPIPGATSARHAHENAETLTWELSDEEFRAIDQASSPASR